MRIALYLAAVLLAVDAIVVSATGGSASRMAAELVAAVTLAWIACEVR